MKHFSIYVIKTQGVDMFRFIKRIFLRKNKWICVNCGKAISSKKARGSMQRPYCMKCFKILFDDDYQKYWNAFFIHEECGRN